jgi:NADH-quinone oxidoreductase subunit M
MSFPLLASEAGSAAADFPLLTAIVLVPIVGSVVTALITSRRPDQVRLVALLFSVATGALTVNALASFESGEAGFQMVQNSSWISNLGASWHLGIDGISLFLVVLTGILFPIAMLAAPPHHDDKSFYAWLLLLQGGCLGAFMALDLLLFFVMFEIVLVPMYFLISGWGYDKRRYAANKFFLYTMFGSAFMLVGTVATAVLSARGSGGDLTFDLVEIASRPDSIPLVTARWLFLAFAIAFAVKVPLFPLHTWLPDAHTEAPTAGSVILAGVMLKLGTYGFLRFGLYLFPEASSFFAPTMVTLGVIGIIYGAICAAMQSDLKRLVAYSSVAHLGFIALGTFALNRQGLEGSVLQMVSHGISTGALFILVGMIYERRHTREIAKLRGLQKSAPLMAGVFTVVMLSSVGLPGLNGFVGEYLILLGSFMTRRWWAVVGATGVILAALYLLWAYQRVFHGEPDEDNADFAEMKVPEFLVMAPLLGLIVFMGVYPKPFLDRIEPSVVALVEHVEEGSCAEDDGTCFTEPAVAEEGKESREDTYETGREERERVEAEAEAEEEEHEGEGEGD